MCHISFDCTGDHKAFLYPFIIHTKCLIHTNLPLALTALSLSVTYRGQSFRPLVVMSYESIPSCQSGCICQPGVVAGTTRHSKQQPEDRDVSTSVRF